MPRVDMRGRARLPHTNGRYWRSSSALSMRMLNRSLGNRLPSQSIWAHWLKLSACARAAGGLLMYKCRGAVTGAGRCPARLPERSEKAGSASKLHDELHVTYVGCVIRKALLDEPSQGAPQSRRRCGQMRGGQKG